MNLQLADQDQDSQKCRGNQKPIRVMHFCHGNKKTILLINVKKDSAMQSTERLPATNLLTA